MWDGAKQVAVGKPVKKGGNENSVEVVDPVEEVGIINISNVFNNADIPSAILRNAAPNHLPNHGTCSAGIIVTGTRHRKRKTGL